MLRMTAKGRTKEERIRVRSVGLLLLCGWASVLAMYAQGVNSSDEATARVHGVVLNAVTQSPIRRALVMTLDQHMAVMTDDKGRFEFEVKVTANRASSSGAAPAGSVPQVGPEGLFAAYLLAKKPGYQVVGPPSPIPIGDQSALNAEMRLQLMPEGAVGGKVSASGVDSLTGLNVQLLRRQVQDGTAVWQQFQTQQLDARGRYRFGGLMPGEYKIVTAEWIDRLGPLVTTSEKPMIGYPPQAYPNGTSTATAGVLHLGGGQTIEADVNLRGVPYYPVEIPVQGSSSGTSIGVIVVSEDGPGYSLGYNAQTRRVEGVLPDGMYHLTVVQSSEPQQQDARQNILVGTEDLNVAGKSAHGTPILCMRGAIIPIKIHEEYTRPDPNEQPTGAAPTAPSIEVQSVVAIEQELPETSPGKDVKVLPPTAVVAAPRAVDVFLASKDESGEGGLAMYQMEGSGKEGLSLENVAPGRFRVLASARRGYVASITANGSNLMREPLMIEPGAAAPAIEIVLRDDFATITGTVSGASVKQVASIFPRTIWAYPMGGEDAARPVAGSEESNGTFTIANVVPGKYLVIACNGQAPNLEYRNQDAMKAYESKGVIVSLSPGQTMDVQLKDVISSAEWMGSEGIVLD